MSESVVIDAPQIEPAQPVFDVRWKREYEAFTRLLPELLKTERGKFVAIHGGGVVAVAETFKDAALKAYERIGYVPMHVGQVSENRPVAVRLPSPRLERPAVSA